MATRRPFDPSADPTAIDNEPGGEQRSGGCFADGCPLPGTISTGGRSWHCAWHHDVLPTDVPRVTQVLKDWECLTYEIRVGRAVLCGRYATDPKGLRESFEKAQQRVLEATASGGWADTFEAKPGEDYGTWLLTLQRFLGARVHHALGYAKASQS